MKELFEVLFVGLALSADSFSAALALGFRPHTGKDSAKFAFASGFAEAGSALLGAILGAKVIAALSGLDGWIAFGILLLVALHMVKEAVEGIRGVQVDDEAVETFHSFKKVLLVSFATSLDALGVGVGLGISSKPLVPYALSIGLWAIAATFAGLFLARRVSGKWGPVFSLFGAGILIIMAFQALTNV